MAAKAPIFWQLALMDGGEPWFREGDGFDDLLTALNDVTAWQEEHTPDGLIPSGNLSMYWYRGEHKDAVAKSRPQGLTG